VHLICVDPPYYNNVQYAELSNFFYVWLKRALHDWPGLAHLFREPLAESNREAVANAARWQREAYVELAAWQTRYDTAIEALHTQNMRARDVRAQALALVGPQPPSARERADRFYEDKMATAFRRARQLLHPAGRMVVMFNHKETWVWRSLGMALIRAGFEIRSSAPFTLRPSRASTSAAWTPPAAQSSFYVYRERKPNSRWAIGVPCRTALPGWRAGPQSCSRSRD
jgi:adenine-specific DNA methylase